MQQHSSEQQGTAEQWALFWCATRMCACNPCTVAHRPPVHQPGPSLPRSLTMHICLSHSMTLLHANKWGYMYTPHHTHPPHPTRPTSSLTHLQCIDPLCLQLPHQHLSQVGQHLRLDCIKHTRLLTHHTSGGAWGGGEGGATMHHSQQTAVRCLAPPLPRSPMPPTL